MSIELIVMKKAGGHFFDLILREAEYLFFLDGGIKDGEILVKFISRNFDTYISDLFRFREFNLIPTFNYFGDYEKFTCKDKTLDVRNFVLFLLGRHYRVKALEFRASPNKKFKEAFSFSPSVFSHSPNSTSGDYPMFTNEAQSLFEFLSLYLKSYLEYEERFKKNKRILKNRRRSK